MRFIVLAEDSLGERSAMMVVAEDMPSALFTLAAEAAKTGSDILNGECSIIPLCDQPEEMGVNTFEDEENAMIQAYVTGHLQRVNVCNICICEDCEPGLCHSEGYTGRPIDCCRERLDAAIMEEMQTKQQVSFTMGTVFRVAQEQ